MYLSVRSQFIPFNAQFEGRMRCMYLDTHEPPLVTTGVGNLIDPISEALTLPFFWKARPGQPKATSAEIAAEWTRIKSKITYIHFRPGIWDMLTELALDDAEIDTLVLDRASKNELILKKRTPFAQFDSWPADAQLGILSMSWAMGPGFNFPNFAASCSKRDFAGAAQQCQMDDRSNPGLTPRNKANAILFNNAAKSPVPGQLYYPQIL